MFVSVLHWPFKPAYRTVKYINVDFVGLLPWFGKKEGDDHSAIYILHVLVILLLLYSQVISSS